MPICSNEVFNFLSRVVQQTVNIVDSSFYYPWNILFKQVIIKIPIDKIENKAPIPYR